MNHLRKIHLNEYISDVILSLKPRLKRLPHKVELTCPKNIELICKPGMISQLITNLIMNSIVHAFDENFIGVMSIDIKEDIDHIYIHYHDNGKGVPEKYLKKLFEPFFTTKRRQGGSGLGTHIVFNIVTQPLNGTINTASLPDEGLKYDIVIPKHNDKIDTIK